MSECSSRLLSADAVVADATAGSMSASCVPAAGVLLLSRLLIALLGFVLRVSD